MSSTPLTLLPIGIARTPFADKHSAPRQGEMAKGVAGQIELESRTGMLDALSGLETWSRLWLIFHFHLDATFSPKVLPPRALEKIGVLATRSPHRPNPIGLTSVRLVGVHGLVLDVMDLDLVDGTPILDIKPYVPYADAFPDEQNGWLATGNDPGRTFAVAWSALAAEQLAWLETAGIALKQRIASSLSLGPQPHAYRRIVTLLDGTSRLALKEWRAFFTSETATKRIEVVRLESGFRPSQLWTHSAPEIHVKFCDRFGMPSVR